MCNEEILKNLYSSPEVIFCLATISICDTIPTATQYAAKHEITYQAVIIGSHTTKTGTEASEKTSSSSLLRWLVKLVKIRCFPFFV